MSRKIKIALLISPTSFANLPINEWIFTSIRPQLYKNVIPRVSTEFKILNLINYLSKERNLFFIQFFWLGHNPVS